MNRENTTEKDLGGMYACRLDIKTRTIVPLNLCQSFLNLKVKVEAYPKGTYTSSWGSDGRCRWAVRFAHGVICVVLCVEVVEGIHAATRHLQWAMHVTWCVDVECTVAMWCFLFESLSIKQQPLQADRERQGHYALCPKCTLKKKSQVRVSD